MALQMGSWGYFTPISGVIPLLVTGRGPPCMVPLLLERRSKPSKPYLILGINPLTRVNFLVMMKEIIRRNHHPNWDV